MCAYCNIGDHAFRFDPPWQVPQSPFIPQPNPGVQVSPWDLQRLKEYRDLLREVKELEDRLGCPCEPNKADYLKLFADRIAALEKKATKLKPKNARR